jgi:hypothetical protein
MAIDDGVLVMPRTLLGNSFDGQPWLAQPPHVGIVSGFDEGAGTADVLWDNCIFDADVPITSLLELTTPAPSSVTSFTGQIVRRTISNQSNEYIGAVVFLAGIFLPGGPVDFAVIKSVGPGQFFWSAPVGELVVVAGR